MTFSQANPKTFFKCSNTGPQITFVNPKNLSFLLNCQLWSFPKFSHVLDHLVLSMNLLHPFGFNRHRLHHEISIEVKQTALIWVLRELFLKKLKTFSVGASFEKSFDGDD